MYYTIAEDGIHGNEDDSDVMNEETVIEPAELGSFLDYEFENVRVTHNYEVEYYHNCLVAHPYNLTVQSETKDRQTIIAYEESFYNFKFYTNKEKTLLVIELTRKN